MLDTFPIERPPLLTRTDGVATRYGGTAKRYVFRARCVPHLFCAYTYEADELNGTSHNSDKRRVR